ncbi:tetratricopeptide repeat protein [Patescibacteria group bacterium]|nr:tetratricopeptide repeat protein [Patescibacteria group bacterium]
MKNADLRTQAEILKEKATNFRNNGQTKRAIDTYKKLIRLYEQLGQSGQIAEAMQMLGVCYKIENNTEKSILWLEKASNQYQKTQDKIGKGNALRDIGITYLYIKNFEQALKYLEQSERVLQNTNDRTAYGITVAKIGHTYTHIGKFDKAKKLLNQGLKEIRSQDSWFMEMTTLLHLAELEYHQQNFQGLIDNARQALGIIYEQNEQGGQKRRLAQIHGLLAHGYLGLKSHARAKEHYQKSLELIEALDEKAKELVLEDINIDKLYLEFKS